MDSLRSTRNTFGYETFVMSTCSSVISPLSALSQLREEESGNPSSAPAFAERYRVAE
jgi:hypothetical protein